MMWNPDDMLLSLLTANPVLALPICLGLGCAVFEVFGYLFDAALLAFIVAHPVLAFMLTCLLVQLCAYFLSNLSSQKMQDMPADTKDAKDDANLQWPQDTRCPFMTGHRYGSYQTRATPTGSNLQACKRDFAGFTVADPSDVFVVTTLEVAPTPWPTLTNIHKGLEHDYAEAVFAELDTWLRHFVKEPTNGLTERCIALMVNSGYVDFIRKHQSPDSPLMMAQPKFVLMVTAKSEVRVLWFAFMSDVTKLKEGLLGEPFMVKMMSEDLNSMPAQLEGCKEGVTFEFVTAPTSEKDMTLYLQEKMAADFRRAVVHNDCQGLLHFDWTHYEEIQFPCK
jgi:hypothetical protein